MQEDMERQVWEKNFIKWERMGISTNAFILLYN
jgi:hypothetical protein